MQPLTSEFQNKDFRYKDCQLYSRILETCCLDDGKISHFTADFNYIKQNTPFPENIAESKQTTILMNIIDELISENYLKNIGTKSFPEYLIRQSGLELIKESIDAPIQPLLY